MKWQHATHFCISFSRIHAAYTTLFIKSKLLGKNEKKNSDCYQMYEENTMQTCTKQRIPWLCVLRVIGEYSQEVFSGIYYSFLCDDVLL